MRVTGQCQFHSHNTNNHNQCHTQWLQRRNIIAQQAHQPLSNVHVYLLLSGTLSARSKESLWTACCSQRMPLQQQQPRFCRCAWKVGLVTMELPLSLFASLSLFARLLWNWWVYLFIELMRRKTADASLRLYIAGNRQSCMWATRSSQIYLVESLAPI